MAMATLCRSSAARSLLSASFRELPPQIVEQGPWQGVDFHMFVQDEDTMDPWGLALTCFLLITPVVIALIDLAMMRRE
jgi:hypothetical protein